jgi:hypothetical protein
MMGFGTNDPQAFHPSVTSGRRIAVSALLAEFFAANGIHVNSLERHQLADDICDTIAGRMKRGHNAF